MHKIIYPIALLIFLLPFYGLKAQETTAEITGLITNEKSPLIGASVVATHTPTGTQYSTASRKDGRYNIPNLKIGGPYVVTVSFVGYKEERKDSIMLLIGQDYKVDFALIQQSKELEAVVLQNGQQGKVFNNNHTGPQEIIGRVHFESLPAIHRSVEDFAKLIPWSANGSDFGGRNSLFNNTTLDGAGFSNVFGLVSDKRAHIPGLPISIEAIEQMQVNLAPYDVRYGGFAGSNINIVSRSGTNTFKATAYTFLHGSGMTGYKVGDVELPKASYNYNRVGFLLRGPIVKNKLFFLINGEQENEFAIATSFTASESANRGGDFVSAAKADTLNALRQFLISRFQYDPGSFQNYNYLTKKRRIIVKIDWNIGTNTTFSFKYNHFGASKDNAATDNRAPGLTRQPSLTGLPFSGTGYTAFNNYHGFGAELNTNWSDKASNKFQAGYILLRNYRKSIAGKEFPFVDIMDGNDQSYTAFGYEPFSYNNFVNIDIFQISDILTVYKGLHEITFGTQNFLKRYESGYAPHHSGYYRFNSLQQFYDNANGITQKSSYYLQYPATKDGSIPVSKVGINEFSFFVQDKLRFNNRLVLTYGLRLDAPVFQDKFASNPGISSLEFRDGKQYDVGQKPATNILFSPRIGFNWDVSKKVKTQIRGGAGLFAGPPPLLWLSNTASNNGGQFGTLKLRDTAFSPDIHTYYPSGENISPDKSYELALIPPGFKYPQVLKANIAVDRLLPGDIIASIEVAYVKDIIAVYFQNVNLPSSGLAFGGSDNRIRYDKTSINSATNPTIEKAILMNNSHKGYAYSMTLQLQKRVNGFYFGASYTYGQTKSINDGGSLQTRMWNSRAIKGDPNDDELGYADFYLPHRIVAYGSFRKTYAKYFATSVSFIFESAPSGVGSYTYNGDMNNDGSSVNNDLIYIPKDQNDIVLVPVYNTADIRTPAQIWAQLDNFIKQDTYLNNHRGKYAERNAVVLPFFKQLDLNISQEFILGNGKHTLKLSFDIINVGNFLNKNWGKYKTFTSGNSFVPLISSFLQYEGYSPYSDRPSFSFPYLDPENEIPLTSSFKDDTDIYSRWQGQIGIRYSF
ncbi:carboxypeptidase regulatory-like domain-containing protein [soil metagenome]